jgi:hypothetical protein
MKAYIIQTGHFSQAGNFIGYSATGERVHIYKKHIFKEFPMVEVFNRHNGKYDKEWMTFPFYCLAEHLSFNSTEGQEFTRLTAEQISVSKFKLKLSLMNGVEEWSKRDADRAHSIEWCFNDLDKQYTKLKEENKKLQTIIDNLEEQKLLLRQQFEQEIGYEVYKYDELQTDYKNQFSELQAMKWNYEYAQSERERLELLCKQHEDTIISIKHIIDIIA